MAPTSPTPSQPQDLVAPWPPSGMQEICACYFETHVSPMVQKLLRTQELINEKLEDNYMTVQKAADALEVEQRLLKFEFGELVARSHPDHTVLMQEWITKVHTKADANDLARLAAFVESKLMGPQESSQVISPSPMQSQDRVNVFEQRLLEECMARLDQQDAALAKKADSEHVATLVQLQEMRMELLAATAVIAEHKVEGTTAWNNVEGDRAEAKEEQVDPTGQGVSNHCFSKIFNSKLSHAGKDHEHLQVNPDAARNPLDKDLEQPPLDSAISLLPDDSTQDSTQEPRSSKCCTRELPSDAEAAQKDVALKPF